MITKFIKDGTIQFPKTGADILITQLIGFGKEHHEDTVDALTMLVSQILEEHKEGSSLRGYIKWMGGVPRPKPNPKNVKWPIIEKKPGKVTTYMPNGEKFTKFDNGAMGYCPPNPGHPPAFTKNKDGTYTLGPSDSVSNPPTKPVHPNQAIIDSKCDETSDKWGVSPDKR